MQAEEAKQNPAAEIQTHNKSLLGIEIELTISVGKTRLALSDLLKLEKDAVLQLDKRIADPVEIYVGDRCVAQGELEETDDGGIGVRLIEVADMSDGL